MFERKFASSYCKNYTFILFCGECTFVHGTFCKIKILSFNFGTCIILKDRNRNTSAITTKQNNVPFSAHKHFDKHMHLIKHFFLSFWERVIFKKYLLIFQILLRCTGWIVYTCLVFSTITYNIKHRFNWKIPIY